MAASSVDHALKKVLPVFGVESLKNDQKKILDCILSGKDCMAVLPTGYGKSLPFQLYPLLKNELDNIGNKSPEMTPKVIVCSPLIALMKDQVKKLSAIPGFRAGYKGQSVEIDADIRSGMVDLIYASPETLVGEQEWRAAFQKLNVTLLVVDEFHTIYTWGMSTGQEKEAFRKWFASIGELRSLFPGASLLALSATCTLKIRKKIRKVLNLHDPCEITLSPNKSNIKLIIKKVPNAVEMALTWLVDGFTMLKEDFPRCIIYCNSIKDASTVYQYIITECSDFVQNIALFHSESSERNKEEIVSALGNSSSKLKLVIATSALGMGIDIIGCHSIILYGPPSSTIDLVQAKGRVRRDGHQSVAVLLYNSYNARYVDADMKNVIQTTKCRRQALMQSFLNASDLEKINVEMDVHTCCDLCAPRCKCENCISFSLEKMLIDKAAHEDDQLNILSESDSTESEYLSEKLFLLFPCFSKSRG